MIHRRRVSFIAGGGGGGGGGGGLVNFAIGYDGSYVQVIMKWILPGIK